MRAIACAVGWCVVLLLATAASAADDPASAAGGHADHGDHGGHHNPFDLTHGNAGPQLESPAEFQADLAIWTFVVFVVLLVVLGKFAWGPVMKGLAMRERDIADSIAQAHRAAEEATRKLHEYEAQLAKAQEEVRELIERGRREADAIGKQIVADAEAGAQRERERAVAEITAAKGAALRELAESSVDTAIQLASRIVRKQLTPDDHAALISEALERLPSRN